MTINTDVLRVQNYLRDTFIRVAEQQQSVLGQFVEKKMVSGKATFFDKVIQRSLTLNNDIHGATPINDQEFARRMVVVNKYQDADALDHSQMVEIERDTKPAIVDGMNFAINRKMDEVIYNALIGTAQGGESGATAITLASYNSGSNVQAYTDYSSGGLTLARLLGAKKQLLKNKVNKIDLILAVNAEGMDDLFGETKFISRDYMADTAAGPIASGIIGSILGCRVVHVPYLDDISGNNDQRAVLFDADAVKLAIGMAPRFEMAQDPNIGFNYRVFVEVMMGATRLADEAVIDIRHT